MIENDPALLSVQAKAIVDRAKALGLVWTMRPGTLNALDGTNALVIYDGDSEQVGAQVITASVFPGDRVMMIQVPPAGNFVVGKVSVPTVLAYPLARGKLSSAGDVTLTTAQQAVTTLLTVTTTAAAEYIITATFDLDQTASGGNNLGIGELQVNGVTQAEQAEFGVNAAGQRATVTQTWEGTLAADSNDFQLFARKVNNIGTFIARATHTGFIYQVWQ